jgi:hypothetical protein
VGRGSGADDGQRPARPADDDHARRRCRWRAGRAGERPAGPVHGQTAAGIRPGDLSGYDSQQILDILGAQSAAGGFGYGKFAQMGLDNAYSDLEDIASRNEFDPLRDPANSPLAQPGALDNFTALLQRYLGTK